MRSNDKRRAGEIYEFNPTEPSRPTETRSGWSVQKGSRKFSAPFTTKLDPSHETVATPTTYPILNGDNTKVNWTYNGDVNLSGNTVTSLLTSINSTLNAEFDSMNVNLRLRYMFLEYDERGTLHTNNALVAQSVLDAMALASSEMFRTLAYPESIVHTNMPYFADRQTNGQGEWENVQQPATGAAARLVVPMLHYQAVLQNLAVVLSKANQLYLLEQELINMGFQREASIVMDLCAQMNKATVKDRLVVLSNHLSSEFFDYKWFKDFNAVTNVPTRKAFSVREPLCTVSASYYTPDYTLTPAGMDNPIFDTRRDFQVTIGGQQLGVQQLTEELTHMLDQRTILQWARSMYMNNQNDALLQAYPTVAAYFNRINDLLQSFRELMQIFTYNYSELKTYLHVASRAGLLNWSKGTRFDSFKAPATSTVADNLVISDLLQSLLASPTTFVFNDITQSWTFSTMWDEYKGVPVFDLNSGGAFLSVSTKLDHPNEVTHDIRYALPVLFTRQDVAVSITNRVGLTWDITAIDLTGDQLVNNPVYSRLTGFQNVYRGNNENVLRIPMLDVSAEATNQPLIAAAAIRFVQSFFGIGRVRTNAVQGADVDQQAIDEVQVREVAEDIATVARAAQPVVFDYLSHTKIAIIDAQLSPVSIGMVNYFRTNSPLKSSASSSVSLAL